ncbi:MAG: glycosyltransferase family 9 protein [Deltaproteobacteria bacterium]|nr:glycosyltransferase family 9 protein [Deltaproteobacteria bacterium]MCL5277919.1 glycosyltransferase family 9 protein [Deltaproteobacteria bacterium]
MKILLLRFSSLGDVVLTMPVALALKKKYAGATVDLGTKLDYSDLFTPPWPFTNVLYLDDKGVLPFVKEVNERGYDMIADLHAGLRTTVIAPLVRAGSRKRYKKGALARRIFVKTGIRLSPFPSVLERYLSTFGIDAPPDTPWLKTSQEERGRGHALLRYAGVTGNRVIGIAPGARWETKKWGIGRYVELAKRLEQRGFDTVFVFGKGDERDREELSSVSPHSKVVNTPEHPLREVCYAVSTMDTFVSGDTGLMHLAEAVGAPLVSLFGPTTREFGFFPAGRRSVVIEKDTPCRPCSLHGSGKCRRMHHRCMKDISVEDVESAVVRLAAGVDVSAVMAV